MANIAKNIRLLRAAQNMTQDQLAERLHVTRQTVSNYETGKSQPDIDTIVRLAEALQADPNTLIYGIPTPPERKREYVKTAIVVIIALVLTAAVMLLKQPLEELASHYFRIYPSAVCGCLLHPLFYMSIGYAALQVLSLCFVLRPRTQKTVKITLLVLLGLWLVVTIPACADYLWSDYLMAQALETSGSMPKHWSVFSLPVYGPLAGNVCMYSALYSPLFLLPGAALWLFRMKKPTK